MIPMINFSGLISANCDFQGQKHFQEAAVKRYFVSTLLAARTTGVSGGPISLLQADFAGASPFPICLSHPHAQSSCSWQELLNGGHSNSSGVLVNVNILGYELKQWRLTCPIKWSLLQGQKNSDGWNRRRMRDVP